MWLGVSTQAHVSYCTVCAELVTLVVLTESHRKLMQCSKFAVFLNFPEDIC